MTQNAWKIILVAAGLVALNAPGSSMAVATDAVVDLEEELDVDRDFLRLLNEMGGDVVGCPPCPPGSNCCTANCILTCCSVVCPPSAVPNCSCSFGESATCFCEVPPGAGTGKGKAGGPKAHAKI